MGSPTLAGLLGSRSVVSYSSRERRRKARYKRQIAINAARTNRNEATAQRYFLIDAKRDGRCAARGCRIRRGQQIVFRKAGPVTLCVACAHADELVWPQVRPSVSWELRHGMTV
jgi:hypothetical protein